MLDMVVPFGGLPGRTVVSPGRLPGYGSFGGPLRGAAWSHGGPLRGTAWLSPQGGSLGISDIWTVQSDYLLCLRVFLVA